MAGLAGLAPNFSETDVLAFLIFCETKNGWGWKDVIRNPNKYMIALQSVNVETIVAILEPYGYLTHV